MEIWLPRNATLVIEGVARRAVLLATLAALTMLSSQPAASQAKTSIGFWAGEAVPGTNWDEPHTYWNRRDTSFYTPHLWSVLRENRIPLYFNLRYRRDFGPVPPGMPHRKDGLAIVRKANRLGVPVWGWILVPFASGYWSWDGAAAEHFDAVKELVHWARAKHVRLRGVVLDPEPQLNTPFETSAALLGAGTGAELPSLFQHTIDPAGQCAAWREYARIARWARSHRVRLAAAPAPLALDDIEDGRLALQDAAGFVVPNAGWHALFFQAYRSVFSYYLGRDPGSGIVSSYFHSSRREFGDAGQVSLGSSGRGPYRRFSHLVRDVRLAATLGARHVPIYSLERTLRAYGGPSSVVRLAQAADRPFTGSGRARASAPTPQAKAVRAGIRRVDAAALAATSQATDGNGAPLLPNSWPYGCGSWVPFE
ncbi:MAG TPA: hypothetical protein VFW48_11590 [Solirubrobacterales bacterium]|nr:hypothetical protein [Solirubrobacterales bacterium]